MKRSSLIAFLFVITTTCSGIPVLAGNNDPLFVNMTTDQEHRTSMAIGFSKAQFERGHPRGFRPGFSDARPKNLTDQIL